MGLFENMFKIGSSEFKKAVDFQGKGDYKNATKYYLAAISASKNNPDYLNSYAWYKYETSQLDDSAINAINTALKIETGKGYIWDTRACIFAKLGYYNQAFKDWQQAIKYNQKYKESIYSAVGSTFLSYNFETGKKYADLLVNQFNLQDKKFIINKVDEFKGGSVNLKVDVMLQASFQFFAILSKNELRGNGKYNITTWQMKELITAKNIHKPWTLMIEECVDASDLYPIIGDIEYFKFTQDNFHSVCIEVIKVMKDKREKNYKVALSI